MVLHLDFGTLKQTYERWSADKAPRLAAALSFTTIFAIAPVFVIVIAIAGQVLALGSGGHGHRVVEEQLLTAIRRSAGQDAAAMVRGMVSATYGKPHNGLVASILGWIVLVFGAVGLFAALRDALNTVWHVEEPKHTNLWQAVRERVVSGGMLLAIGFLLLVTTAVNAAIAYVSTSLAHVLPFRGAGVLIGALDAIVVIALITLLVGLMYKFVPDAEIAWRDVWPGAFFTAVAFMIGQSLIALYLGRAGVTSAYGAAGALIALLLWVYYSAMILLFGAEFTRVYAEKYGSRASRGTDRTASADEPRARPLLERLNATEDRQHADEHGKTRQQAKVARDRPPQADPLAPLPDDAQIADHHPQRLAGEPDEQHDVRGEQGDQRAQGDRVVSEDRDRPVAIRERRRGVRDRRGDLR
jgi:membrane protein